MLNVFLKYNPYTVVTEIKIDNKELPAEDKLMQMCEHKRLQNWIDQWMFVLWNNYRDDININFQGMSLDGEDVKDAAKQLQKKFEKENKSLIIKVDIKASEPDNQRVSKLKTLYQEGLQCPFSDFAELFASKEMKDAFDRAIDSVFEAHVVATMSSGKSTFINSILGQELLPAANRATTATITKITHRELMNDFRGQRFDMEGKPLSDPDELIDAATMKKWNLDNATSCIDIEGNIPTISANKDMTIAFVDTPGPNNSRNADHRAKTEKAITEKTLSMVLYILNATQLEVNDDAETLHLVQSAMTKGGRQAQDRFVFIVNKIDENDPETPDDAIDGTLERVKKYLGDNGIQNPTIIPISAKLALLLRKKKFFGIKQLTQRQNFDLTDLQKCFLNIPEFNMINYVRKELNPRIITKLENMLKEADDQLDDDRKAEILSGVPIVEQLLNDFIQKHALPAKLKDAVDSFRMLSEVGKQINEMSEILGLRQEELKKASQCVDEFMSSKERIDMANKFRHQIQKMQYEISEEAKSKCAERCEKSNGLITELTDFLAKEKMIPINSLSNAEARIDKTISQCEIFARDMIMILSDALETEYSNTLKEMRTAYETQAADVLNKSFPENSPLKKLQQVAMNMPQVDILIQENKQIKEVQKTNRYWVEPERHWYNPFSWFKSGYYINKTQKIKKEYIDMEPIATELAGKLREFVLRVLADFQSKATSNVEDAKNVLLLHMDIIDEKLKEVQDQLHSAQLDKSKQEEMVAESKEKLVWLKNFNEKLDNILAI